jgi:C4-dicarboxylate transporter DctM subunit
LFLPYSGISTLGKKGFEQMSPALIGIIGIVALLILFTIGMPVGFSMAIIGLAGFAIIVTPAAGLNILARDFFDQFYNYNLTVIPLFMLMGALAYASGMSQRLFDASHKLFGGMRGGLVIATIAGCAGFAAICGSTSATAAAMGRVTLPEMKRYGYDDALATGSVAAAGTLGIMIPPSIIFIVYGIMTEQSIGKLFIAGIVPGAMLAVLFAITTAIMLKMNPALAPRGTPTTLKEKLLGLNGILEMIILFILVIGGLFLGWFSAMQAGAIGAAGALIIGLVRRKLNWGGFIYAIKDTLKITVQIMIIVAGAMLFGHFIAVTRIPMELAAWVAGLPLPPLGIMAIIILLYFVGGTFMDSLAMITLTVPILFPVVQRLGYDPIWFGVIVVLITEIGVISPPEGINVFVIKGIAKDVPMKTIFKGVMPFVFAMLAAAAILLFIPQIATFLPNMVSH